MTGQRRPLSVSRRTLLAGAGVAGVAAVAGCAGEEDEGPAPGTVLGLTNDVPLQGGIVVREHKVVVTQPDRGNFQAFSAVCTHQGCLVEAVTEGTIKCPCHGSTFDASDGSVIRGPAQEPLPRVDVNVTGNSIRLA